MTIKVPDFKMTIEELEAFIDGPPEKLLEDSQFPEDYINVGDQITAYVGYRLFVRDRGPFELINCWLKGFKTEASLQGNRVKVQAWLTILQQSALDFECRVLE